MHFHQNAVFVLHITFLNDLYLNLLFSKINNIDFNVRKKFTAPMKKI